nr:MAG TPA: The ASCH domain adopts a beta-barrel fold similar to that of the PUA domain [Caudoviricetes sp.]
MSRHIDAAALGIGKVNRDVFENKAYADGWNAAIDIITSAPIADVPFGTPKEHFADVLISIHPKWCGLIASGKKTIEVRKTAPKLPTPFECYIYCTKDPKLSFWRSKTYAYADDRSHNMFDIRGNGKVIGEFVCDNIDTYDDDTIFSFRYEDYARWNDFDLNRACIRPEDFQNYADGKWLYGWHISDLEIYDNPRELSDFGKTRPPQSWCYVEEMP